MSKIVSKLVMRVSSDCRYWSGPSFALTGEASLPVIFFVFYFIFGVAVLLFL